MSLRSCRRIPVDVSFTWKLLSSVGGGVTNMTSFDIVSRHWSVQVCDQQTHIVVVEHAGLIWQKQFYFVLSCVTLRLN